MLKTQNSNSLQQVIQKNLDKGHLIRPFPRVVTQLLSAFEDPEACAKTFARIIEADAALSARLLRMSNSPVYGFSNVIRSIEHATVMLGITPLRNLALTFAGSNMFSSGESSAQREALWNHSLGVATTARLLAKSVAGVNPDEAFLAGIFHDVGKLFFHDAIPADYSALVGDETGEALIQIEADNFGVTHPEVGAKLATAWMLPEQIMVVIGNHHDPLQAIAHIELTSVIHVADGLARNGGIGSRGDIQSRILPEALQALRLDEVDLDTVCEQAFEMFEETTKVYA